METGKAYFKHKMNSQCIADANKIPFEIGDYTHKGDCAVTCLKCETE